MYKYILVTILLFFTSKVTAQDSTTYFNKIYTADSVNLFATIVRPVGNNYIVVGASQTTENRFFYMRKIDAKGNTKWLRNFDSQTVGTLGYLENGAMLITTADSNFVVTYGKDTISNTGEKYDVNLVKLDTAANVIWHKKYGKPQETEYPKQVIALPDGGFAISASRWNEQNSRFWLIRTDYKGDTLWTKEYPYQHSMSYYLTTTWWDNGFIITGRIQTDTSRYDMFIVKTDSIGNVKWTRNIGSHKDDCSCKALVITTPEEHLAGKPIRTLITGCVQDEVYWRYYLYNANLDTSGNTLWETIYPQEGLSYNEMGVYYSIETLPLLTSNKGFIGIANGGYPSIPNRNMLVKFDTNGNIKWRKRLDLDTLADMYIKDMQPTADGGYILAGFKFWPSPQLGWVLKIDSLGNTCSFVGCDSTVYTGGVGFNPTLYPVATTAFVVSPNPANNNFTLSYQLPPNIAFGVLELYNTLGQKVLYKQAPQTRTEISVSVAQLPAGVYLYRFVTINGEAASGKIVVQH
jgi:hypothetical protein